MKKTVVFFALLSILFFSCERESSQTKETFDQGPTVSVVNDDTVTAEFFQQAYIQHILSSGRNDTKEERYAFLNSLTDDILLSQQAGKYDLIGEQYEEYMDQVRRISVADRFYSASFLDTLSLPDEQQVETAFFNTKVKLHVSHLFFTDQKEAEQAYQRLQNGESFLDLANEIYNVPQYDSTAGYLGEISYFNVDDAFGEAAYELKAGEYSEPVRTRQGHQIIFVNNRIGNPIMTNAEFEYKKEGITGLTKKRIMTLKGDAFVQTYMQSLDVNVDQESVRDLFERIRQIKPRNRSNPVPSGIPQDNSSYPTSAEVEFVEQEFNPNTPIASYTHLGEERIFTAGDYFDWLKTIPLEEARNRTMASVGRALRNQVFFEAGLVQDIENDPIVEYNMDYRSKFYKTYLVKEYLSEQPVPDIPIEEQKAAFRGMDMNAGKSRTFSGWVITADSFKAAQEIKNAIQAGKSSPDSYPNYEYHKGADVRKVYALQSHVFRAPLNKTVVANSGEAFYVMNVSERDMQRVEFEEVQDQVIERMSKYYNVVKEIQELRADAEISVDTTAFESLMKHFDDPSLQGRRLP